MVRAVLPRFAFTAAVLFFAILGGPMSASAETAYDFSFSTIEGKPLPLSTYRGKTVLLVNTASECGYTPQYKGLQALWRKYKDRGLVVLGVPSNDFGGQEPGTNADIKKFCEINYDVDFPLAEKAPVKGAAAHPFYKWAVMTLGPDAAPKWNFHKYLIGPDGKLVAWFPTKTDPLAPNVTTTVETHLPK